MKKLLGVTGCPTGIAHTYMAEEALKEAAKKLGAEMKVETNGAVGVENALTAEDIAECDGIIVACDKNVDMKRFNGKKVIEVSVSEGINKAEELVQAMLDGKAPVYGGSEAKAEVKEETVETGNTSVAHQIYKHLMNGVSHMLPFVVAGGVLTAISFLWGIYSFDPTSDQYNVIAATIKTVGGTSMGLMVPIFAAFIAQSIGDRPGMIAGFVGGTIASTTGSGFIGGIIAGFFAGYLCKFVVGALKGLPRQFEGLKSIFFIPIITVAIVGIVMQVTAGPVAAINNGMMNFLAGLQNSNPVILGLAVGCMSAFDMGGPVNKAAYVFGTASIAAGNYNIMAAVMVGGMVPPIALALATLIFKNKFTEDERKAGPTNFIMGLSFITEGAIPFAASDPLHVLPACVVGSAVAGALSMAFNCTLMAPHGGIFVFLTVGNPLLYLVSLAVGSAVGCVLLGVLKKKAA
jgi:PTS system fructose-specific IIC component